MMQASTARQYRLLVRSGIRTKPEVGCVREKRIIRPTARFDLMISDRTMPARRGIAIVKRILGLLTWRLAIVHELTNATQQPITMWAGAID
jgi:hypothetical protein